MFAQAMVLAIPKKAALGASAAAVALLLTACVQMPPALPDLQGGVPSVVGQSMAVVAASDTASQQAQALAWV